MAMEGITERGYATLRFVLIALVLLAVSATGLYVYKQNKAANPAGQSSAEPTELDLAAATFDDCVKAGNPVQKSFPEKCTTKEGKIFVNSKQAAENAAPGELVIREWGIKLAAPKAEYLTYTVGGPADSPYGPADASAVITFTDPKKQLTSECQQTGLTAYKLKSKPSIGEAAVIGGVHYILQINSVSCKNAETAALRKQVVAGLNASSLQQL